MKKLTSILAIMILAISLSTPTKSNAMAALNGGALVVAPIMLGVGLIPITAAIATQKYNSSLMAIGLGFIALGLIILDEKEQVKFQEISLDKAQELEVDQEAIATYNTEIDYLNVISEDLATSNEKEVESLWEQHKESLSPDTITVLNAIGKKSSIKT